MSVFHQVKHLSKIRLWYTKITNLYTEVTINILNNKQLWPPSAMRDGVYSQAGVGSEAHSMH